MIQAISNLILLSLIQKFKAQNSSTIIIPFIFFPSSSIHSAQWWNWKQKPQRNTKTSTTSPSSSNTFQAGRVTQNLLNNLYHSHVGIQHPKCSQCKICQGLSFPIAENSPSFGEMNKHPTRIISLHLSATLYSADPFFMYFSILYEEIAMCLGDLKVFRWPEGLFLSFWLHWTLIFWRCITDLKETLK